MKVIMVVDDMAIIREPIAKSLESRGYAAISIPGGQEALAAIARQRPDLILLDVMMPQFDGLAVLRALKSNPRYAGIPVIMLTAAADKERILEAAKLGVRDYVLKSQFNMVGLVERIEARLAQGESAEAKGDGPRIGGTAPSAATRPTVIASAHPADSVRRLAQAASITSRAQIMERLAQCGELKPLSPTISRLIELVNGNDCSTEQIARTIQQDQAIAVKILKLANSIIYTRGQPVDSVHKAVQRIGTNPIKQLVMNLGVIEQFGSLDGCSRLSATQFWEHSIACGLIAAEITRCRGGGDAGVDAAFTMGLLHDVGRMIFAQVLGEQYNQVLAMADELRLPLEQVESRLLTVNHAEAMETVLRAWRFPKDMIKPIVLHHLPLAHMQRSAGDSFPEAATLALADRLAHALLLGSSGNDVIYPTDELAPALKLSPDVITRIERD